MHCSNLLRPRVTGDKSPLYFVMSWEHAYAATQVICQTDFSHCYAGHSSSVQSLMVNLWPALACCQQMLMGSIKFYVMDTTIQETLQPGQVLKLE